MSELCRAQALYDSKQFAAALPFFLPALRRSKQKKPDGASSAETADILFKIGYCYEQQRDLREAAEHYRHAAALSSYGFDGQFLASLNAAKAFCRIQDFVEGDKLVNISRSLIDAKAAAGATAPTLLKTYRVDACALSAKILRGAGRYSEALPYYEDNLAHYESIYDNDSLVRSLTGLGEIYMRQGLSEKALEMARRAQSLNPSNAASLGELSYLLSDLKLFDEALKYAQKALECEERKCGNNTPNYALILEQIGSRYSALGQLDNTLSWFHRARAAYEKLGMTSTANFGSLLNNTGVVCLQMNYLSDHSLFSRG